MGTLRLYLAVCVFLAHCWNAPRPHVVGAGAAVFCFFILSGFLISMAIHRDYPETSDGTLRFYANRVLRLYPIYLTVLVATAIANATGLIPYGIPGINVAFSLIQVLDQTTVLPHILWVHLTGAPGTNTLAIGWYYTVGLEMMFYILAPFFVRWKLPNLILLFIACAIVHFLPYMLGAPQRQWQYEFFPSTAVFFVAGALSYRLYVAIKDAANPHVGWLLLAGVAAYGIIFDAPVYTNSFEPIALYALLTLTAPFLFIASKQRYVRTVDAFLGNLAYPFYVAQGLSVMLVGGNFGQPTNVMAALSVNVAISIALVKLMARLERIRDAIRGEKMKGSRYGWRDIFSGRDGDPGTNRRARAARSAEAPQFADEIPT